MDLIGWDWEYEPLDFNGYIPDFLVNDDFWLEVKAAMTLAELAEEAPKVHRALADQDRRAVIVGGRPIHAEGLQDIMGLLVVDEAGPPYFVCPHDDCERADEPHPGAQEYSVGYGEAFRGSGIPDSSLSDTDPRAYDRFEWKYCGEHKRWTVAEDDGDWSLACGCSHKCAKPRYPFDLEEAWREASNLTQWHPKNN